MALRLANSYSFSELRSFVLEIWGSCLEGGFKLIQAKPRETDGCTRSICITWIIIGMGQIYNLDTLCHSSVLTQNIGQALKHTFIVSLEMRGHDPVKLD